MKVNVTLHDLEHKNDKFNIRLDIIAVIIFALPLVMRMPEWYLVLEALLGIMLIILVCLGAATLLVLLSRNLHSALEKEFFTVKRGLGWCMNIVIITSMFIQELDWLLAVYLITLAAFNTSTYMWLKKPVDSSTDS